jgi:hypothetical protein
MKAKKRHLRAFKPMPAVAAAVALAAAGAHADNAPVFSYQFPASWGGTGTAVTDQSSAGNNGVTSGTLSLASAVPPGAAAGTQSINTTNGGVLTSAGGLLNNATVAAAGGFNYNVSFLWNGTDSASFGHTEKIIDYAGTESLQLVTTTGSASLQMVFGSDTGVETVAASTSVLPNTWYNVSLHFNTAGNSLVGGDISGTVDMNVNGVDFLGTGTKGTYGDSLNRPIGVGQLGANFGYLVGFKGDIYGPSVSLVPEPSSLALGLMGSFGVFGAMWKARRRKA